MLKRRGFLLLSGVLAAAGQFYPRAAEANDSSTFSPAALISLKRRVVAATAERDAFRLSRGNGDPERFAASGAVITYAKGFARAPNGSVDAKLYDSYTRAITRRNAKILDPKVQGINRNLLELALSDQSVIAGCDPRGIPLPPAPQVSSSEQAVEAVELAWLALTRDVPFAAYDSDPLVEAAARELQCEPATLLRPRHAKMTGPMISQLALREISMDPLGSVPQRLPCFAANTDYLTARDEWLPVQSGGRTGNRNVYDSRPRFICTARDLAGWVSDNDPFINAAAIIDALPYEAHAPNWAPQSQSGLLGFGFGCAGVGTMFHKLIIHRRLRPEELFGFIDRPDANVPLSAALDASPALDRLQRRFGSRLLPQAYAAGAPSYAAYPAGHAVGAGIAATMLKANVNGAYVFSDPVMPNVDGSALIPYAGPPLTLEDEIDKLAYNYAYGRHAAGVHYRSDSDAGLRYGESIALAVLRDLAYVAGSSSYGYQLRTFNGESVKIG